MNRLNAGNMMEGAGNIQSGKAGSGRTIYEKNGYETNRYEKTVDEIFADRKERAVETAYRKERKDPAIETVYKKIRYRNTMPDSRVLVFMAGFCLGMVFFYCNKTSGANANPLEMMIAPSRLSQLKNFQAYKSGLLEYVAISRFSQLLFLFLCATSAIGSVLAYGILGWCGFELGLLIFTAVYQHGMIGMLLSLLLFLPHGIFYSIAFLMVFQKVWGINKKNYHNQNTINSNSWHNKLTEFRKILVILTIQCFGILSETYINSEIIKKIALFF